MRCCWSLKGIVVCRKLFVLTFVVDDPPDPHPIPHTPSLLAMFRVFPSLYSCRDFTHLHAYVKCTNWTPYSTIYSSHFRIFCVICSNGVRWTPMGALSVCLLQLHTMSYPQRWVENCANMYFLKSLCKCKQFFQHDPATQYYEPSTLVWCWEWLFYCVPNTQSLKITYDVNENHHRLKCFERHNLCFRLYCKIPNICRLYCVCPLTSWKSIICNKPSNTGMLTTT